MRFDVTVKRKFHKKRTLTIDSDEGISVLNDDKDAVLYLMQKALNQKASIIIFGSKSGWFEKLSAAPEMISPMVFTSKGLKTKLKFPWIMGLNKKAIETMERCFEEYNEVRTLGYLKSLEPSPLYADPFFAQCLYEIKDTGNNKDRVLCEALFSGLLKNLSLQEGPRDVVIFLEAPYQPFTEEALRVIEEAYASGIPIVCVYKDDAKEYCDAAYKFTLKNKKGYLELSEGLFEVADET